MLAHTIKEFAPMTEKDLEIEYSEAKLRVHVEHYHCDLKHITKREVGF